MPPPVVTLTFDLLTPRPDQHLYEPNYVRDDRRKLGKIPFIDF